MPKKPTKRSAAKKKAAGISALAISPKEQAQFQAEDDVRSLKRVEEIKSDKRRMTAANKLVAKDMKVLKKVAKETS